MTVYRPGVDLAVAPFDWLQVNAALGGGRGAGASVAVKAGPAYAKRTTLAPMSSLPRACTTSETRPTAASR